MAESSWPWTDGAGDGGPYAANTWDDDAEILLTTDQAASQGVVKGYLNELEVTGAASPVSVASGAGIVKGKRYKNTAAVDVSVPTPSASTRIDRIVLEVDFTGQTVRIARVAGTEGGGAPALTQTDGTTWQISLAQASITTGGVITVTDERAYAKYGTAVDAGMIDNRTRKFFVQCPFAYNVTGAAEIETYSAGGGGWPLPDAALSYSDAGFYIPSDFVSGMTVVAVVVPTTTGNVYGYNAAYLGAAGEATTQHNEGGSYAAHAVTADIQCEIASLSLTDAAAGDYVRLRLARDATNALDTSTGDVFFAGWLVSYTADS